jgi:hypothetical protein
MVQAIMALVILVQSYFLLDFSEDVIIQEKATYTFIKNIKYKNKKIEHLKNRIDVLEYVNEN